MPAPSGRISDVEHPAVRVFTLGRFQVEVGGTPLRSGRKAQRRPLDLLKLLIAYGGQGVPAEQIAEDLWPDSEGDAALAALRTTLSRLRKLLGATAILGAGRALTLNQEACWVDALALKQRLSDCRHGGQEDCSPEVHAALDDALSLYGGHFLPGECSMPVVLSARARLHSVMLRHLADFGRCYEQAGLVDRAISLYRRGLEIDATAEETARRLMQCCRNCGRCAEGIAVYRSCQDALKSRLGAEPSAATRAVYHDLLRESARGAETLSHPVAARISPAFAGESAELSVAVLPFEDLSPRGDQQRLTEAIRETVIALLGAVPQISLVTVRRSAVSAAGVPAPVVPQGESAVRYFLRGRVMASGKRLRAGVHLVDARTGQYVWSERLDRTLGDLTEARDQIAIQVADALVAKMVHGHYPVLLLKPDIQVWKAMTLVLACLNRQGRQDYRRARVLLGRIVELKQQQPDVLMLSACVDISTAWKRLTPDPERSLRAGEQKLRRVSARYGYYGQGMPNLAWACALRGDFGEALLHGRRVVDRMPQSFLAHAFLGLPLQYGGQHAEALGKMDDALCSCPQPPHWFYKDRAVAQFCLGRYDEAARGLATPLVDEYPAHRNANLLNARMMYVASLAASGRVEQARHEAAVTLAAHPTVTASDWCDWHFLPYRAGSPAQRIKRLLVASGLPH
jgi:DNA-binding SARP family transcriptional activator